MSPPVQSVQELHERACSHLLAQFTGVSGLVEEVGVDIESDGGAGVAEDAADLGDIELEVDDQVAGERVAEVVEAKAPPVAAVERGRVSSSLEAATADVALAVRRAVRGREDPVLA